ncbi:MAG: hypothetical protein M3R63_02245 [Actinomycetota bacterium]|nr:hypothetical protein [Actinomycetota bacterium]
MSDEHVRADLVRSGGFAGLTRRSSVDTATLPPDEARQLRDLVAGLDFAALADAGASRSRAPDSYSYDLTIVRGPERVRVVRDDRGIGAELRPLIRFLDQRTQPG